MPILQFGDERNILRQHCRPAPAKEDDRKRIAEYLIATCAANNVIGLSASQIGFPVRMMVLHIHPTEARPDLPETEPLVMVNPEIKDYGGKGIQSDVELGWEGCGSLPGIFAKVLRYIQITVNFMDVDGMPHYGVIFTGLAARVIQHELDHFKGVNFLQRAELATVVTTEHYIRLREAERRQKRRKTLRTKRQKSHKS